MSTNKLSNGFILVSTGQCPLCAALETFETSDYWSVSIGRIRYGGSQYTNVYADHWTTKLSYVCQYHSKSLYGLSLSVYQSDMSVSDDV